MHELMQIHHKALHSCQNLLPFQEERVLGFRVMPVQQLLYTVAKRAISPLPALDKVHMTSPCTQQHEAMQIQRLIHREGFDHISLPLPMLNDQQGRCTGVRDPPLSKAHQAVLQRITDEDDFVENGTSSRLSALLNLCHCVSFDT